jgi:hypothetical protein
MTCPTCAKTAVLTTLQKLNIFPLERYHNNITVHSKGNARDAKFLETNCKWQLRDHIIPGKENKKRRGRRRKRWKRRQMREMGSLLTCRRRLKSFKGQRGDRFLWKGQISFMTVVSSLF